MRKGDIGPQVTQLQKLLNATGFKLDVDSIYGASTEAAVKTFQQRIGLVTDGEAGPKTLTALTQREKTKAHLTQADLQAAADRLSLPIATVMAVNNVESKGQGFQDADRPVILYERHIAYKRIAAISTDSALFLASRYPNLINPKPGGYSGGTAEHNRLANARQITADYPGIADESCSWGLFQIMGYHWQTLGYVNIRQFVAAMSDSEAGQLDAFVRFIEADPALHKALKAKKWADFARGYNGPAYKANLYDIKLARAFERFTDAQPDASPMFV